MRLSDDSELDPNALLRAAVQRIEHERGAQAQVHEECYCPLTVTWRAALPFVPASVVRDFTRKQPPNP